MNKKEIEELIKFVAKAGVSEVSLEMKDIKITIKNASTMRLENHGSSPQQMIAPTPAMQTIAALPATAVKEAAKVADDAKYLTVKSPMIGTFYRTPSPDKPNFVSVGDEIQPGNVLCIIEAMKLFNEIEAEIKGKIVKVLVENATPVEYDTPLFLVDPS